MSIMNYENIGSFSRSCNGSTLSYDQACLQVITGEVVSFWSQYEECEGCKLLETARLPTTGELVLSTYWGPLRYSIRNGYGEICNGFYNFGEFGQYTINLTEVTRDCPPRMTAEPDAAHLPILTAVVVLLAMATLWYIVKGIGKRIVAGRLYARFFAKEDNELGSETRVMTAEDTPPPRSPSRARLRSLDIFRGFTIALMIFVNSGGGGYAVFSHAAWHGLTIADLVFPWFAFAMGQALVLSLNAKLRTAVPRLEAFNQVARRALIMSLIGIVLSSQNASWFNVRLPGVLQRLAAMYFVVGALECAFMRTSQNITPGRSLLRDISAGWQQWLATLLLVAIQVCITLLVAAPGCPRGYMGPGGLHLSVNGSDSLQNCTGGVAGYIDRLILGEHHLLKGGSYRTLYRTTEKYDPEGLLGILSGVLVVQAGAHASRIMLAYNHARARIMRWVFHFLLFGVSGGLLCMFSKSGGVIPLNKNLWSLSYCLVTSSMAFLIHAVLYFAVDLKNKWGGRPLYYAGQNALIIYIGSQLLKHNFPLYWHIPAPTHSQLLATNAFTVLIWLAVGVALHRKRVFITL